VRSFRVAALWNVYGGNASDDVACDMPLIKSFRFGSQFTEGIALETRLSKRFELRQ
jgi:hypothetical protein